MTRSWREIQPDPALLVDYVLWVEAFPYALASSSEVGTAGLLTYDGTTRGVLPLLDLDDGLVVSSCEWVPGQGVASGGSVELAVTNDSDDTMLGLLRTTGAHRTYLDADLTASGTTITVVSTTGFSSSGSVYLGRERVSYTGTTGTTFTGCTRGAYDTVARSYSVDPDSRTLPPVVTDYPGSVVGRWARLLAVPRATGTPHAIYAGVIRECEPDETWSSWRVTIDDAVLAATTPIQIPRYEGALAESTDGLWYVSSTTNTAYFIIEGTETSATLTLSDGLYTVPEVLDDLCSQLYTAASAIDATIQDCVWIEHPNWPQEPSYFVLLRYNSSSSAVSADVRWSVVPDSLSPFSQSGDLSVAGLPYVFPGYSAIFSGWRIYAPDAIAVDPGGTVLPVIEDETTGTWPSSGYAIISDGDDTAEVIYYSGRSASSFDGIVLLTLDSAASGRGLAGTTAQYWPLTGDHVPAIRYATWFPGAEIGAAIRATLVSTGDGTNGTYDVLDAGLGIPEWAVATDSFDAATSLTISALFTGDVEDAVITDELAYRGYSLISRVDDTGYRITLGGPYQATGDTHTVTATEVVRGQEPRYQSFGERVNRVTVHNRYLVADAEFDTAVVVNDLAGQQRIQRVENLDLFTRRTPAPGLTDAIEEAAIAAGRIFAWLGQARYVIRMGLVRAPGWQLAPGDRLSVTYSGVPLPDGTRGLSSTPMVVRRATYYYTASGEQAPALVEAEYVPDLMLRRWSPTARVTAAAGTTLTLSTAEFGSSDNPDYSYFSAGDEVTILRAGQLLSSAVSRTISSISGATCVIDSAIGWAPGADTYMIFEDYGTVQTSQRPDVAWVTDASGVVSGTTEGGKWA